MRFMMIVKTAENAGPPPKEFAQAVSKLGEDAAKSGKMVGGGGLAPTAKGTRVRLSHGEISVVDGPFTEAKEVVGGFAIFELQSKEEAIETAQSFMEVHKKYWPGWQGETEIRQLVNMQEAAHTGK